MHGRLLGMVVFCGSVLLAPTAALAEPGFAVSLGETGAEQTSTAVRVILLLTVLSFAPAILLATTSFLRVIIVLSFVRSALGTQGMPPTQVLTGLALFLTLAVMAPTGRQVYAEGLRPYLDSELGAEAAFDAGSKPLRTFMLRQTREADIGLFFEMNHLDRPARPEDVPMHLLVPAFITSELRTGFEMGFMLLLPFLLVDLVVSSVLMGLGMVMLPPTVVSLPVKVLLFVVVDGWHLLVGSLVRSFG